MSPRQFKILKRERCYSAGIDTYIERLRKARALGCSLSYLGIDSQECRKLSFNRMSPATK